MKAEATVLEIAEALGKSKVTILRRAEKERWPYKTGPNRTKLFTVNKLPDEIKMTLNTPIAAATTSPTLLYRDAAPAAVGSPDLSEQQNRVALARADFLRFYMGEKQRAKKKKESVTAAAKLWIKGYNTGQLLPKVFEILGKVSFPTAEAWLKSFRDANFDYVALAPKWGNRKGQRKVTDAEFNALLSFGLHPNRLRLAEVARLTKSSLRRRQIASPSSKDTLVRALKDWISLNYDQWVFCREGEKALNDKCLPYLERDAGLLEVGEVLVADGHKLNFEVLHPFTGKPARMILLCWYDWASCMPVGYAIMPTENVQCVAASMRRAIITLGKMPKVAYLDNGKAFKAKIFTDTSIDFEEAGFYGMFARLGIETLFAWAYNAQSKVVERFFSTFNELERLMPTYTGASIADKPARMLRNEKLHARMHAKKYGGWVPTIEEALRIVAGWFGEYAQRPHKGLKGLRPADMFAAGKGPGVDETLLRHLMMSMEIKNVYRNGIRFMERHYYDEALYGIKTRVMVRYDLEDLSRLYVYDETGGKLICEALPREPVHPVARISGTPEDLCLVKEGIRQKRSLKKQTEAAARTYVEEAPTLVEIPHRPVANAGGAATKKTPAALPKAEAERIEAEAAKMKVLPMTAKKPEPIYMSEPDRYEALLEMECRGQEIGLDDMAFMRYFETTDLFKTLSSRFEFLREYFIAGPEHEEREEAL